MLTSPSKGTLDIPRDRSGPFYPKLIARYQRRFPEFDDKIISIYARGMTVREIRVKTHDEGVVRNKIIYITPGILPDGTRDILGLWIEPTEDVKFWLRVMNELENGGLGDILVAIADSK